MKPMIGLGAIVGIAAAGTLVAAGRQPASAQKPSPPSAQAQPIGSGLPDGKGRDVLLRDCSGCHSPALVKDERHDAKGWDDLIGVMIDRGAQVSNADQGVIRDYLARNFGGKGAGAK